MTAATTRRDVIGAIARDLGNRALVWFGTRGDDVEGVTDITNLAAAFSIINRYQGSSAVQSAALERFSGLRVDLDAHDIDEDPYVEPIRALRRRMLDVLTAPSVVFTYRPSTFLSAMCFVRAQRTQYLGMFKDHHAAFEHKPWVESAVARLGVPTVEWRYVADSERSAVEPMLRDGRVMLRVSRSSGGTGVTQVGTVEELTRSWPTQEEAFVSVSRFVADGVPLNVGGVVWDDGVTVEFPSVQLIGVPELTSRPFGYCGNDFAAAQAIDPVVLAQVESSTQRIGAWLGSLGFRGAFGADYLLAGGRPLFLEVNPRFQGSTAASSRMARAMGDSCIMTDHLAALLHHPMTRKAPLTERVAAAPATSHVVVHRTGTTTPADGLHIARALSGVAGYAHADVLHPADLECEFGATVARVSFARSVTTTGFDLDPQIRAGASAPAGSTAHHEMRV